MSDGVVSQASATRLHPFNANWNNNTSSFRERYSPDQFGFAAFTRIVPEIVIFLTYKVITI